MGISLRGSDAVLLNASSVFVAGANTSTVSAGGGATNIPSAGQASVGSVDLINGSIAYSARSHAITTALRVNIDRDSLVMSGATGAISSVSLLDIAGTLIGNNNGRVVASSINDDTLILRPGYRFANALSDQANANGTITRYNQNSRLWPSSFSTEKAGDPASYISSSYRYDGIGNLTNVSDAVDTTYNRDLGYDSINRLTQITGPWGGGTLTYDGAGNITSQVLGNSSRPL